MKHDWQAITQPLNLDSEDKPQEELPVYDDPETGTSLRGPHIWSFDQTLAQILDEGLTRMLNFEYYLPEPGMVEARNIFRRYANKWETEEDVQFEQVDSESYKELMWALDWLKENFTGLWT